MKIESINASIKKVKEMLENEKKISPVLKASVEILICIITLLINRLKLNSSNSSKPPSTDPNRKRKEKKPGEKKPGGQKGHKGSRLEKEENPDKVTVLKIDKKSLPPGTYREVGFECRQVVDIEIKKIVTEYRAQILEDENGKKYVAPFPKEATSDVQYGNSIKEHSTYMSLFQLLPYNRIRDYFTDQMNIPISAGSIFNFNKEAFDLLESFDRIAKKKLIESDVNNADETGINIGGKRLWLHLVSNKLWTHYYPHEKRGSEAMDAIGIIPNFSGILMHDHWKPYYNDKYKCSHGLCNAHHIRELERAAEQEGQKWAIKMKDLLLKANEEVIKANGALPLENIIEYRSKYRDILKEADIECPTPPKVVGKRGRTKQSFSRNLIDRFIGYEDDTLRFMENDKVPFTNNLAENDLRMTKVQQKISGCFRSMEGAYIFCRVRGYLSTCRKHGIAPTDALKILFEGKLPDFICDS